MEASASVVIVGGVGCSVADHLRRLGWRGVVVLDQGPLFQIGKVTSACYSPCLERTQIENIRLHGVTPAVAINSFPTDHDSEHTAIREVAEEMSVRVAVCNHFSEVGAGAAELAEAVAEAAQEPTSFHFLYPDEASLREKIETIAEEVEIVGLS